MRRPLLLISPLLLTILLGAGCTTLTKTPSIAQPFDTSSSTQIAIENGFGTLPAIPHPTSTAQIILGTTLPNPPKKASVLRYKPGTPNETELRNVASALNLPAAILGKRSESNGTYLSWIDEDGRYWSYDGITRKVFFGNAKQNFDKPQALPTDEAVYEAASNFLNLKQLPFRKFRIPYIVNETAERAVVKYNLMIDNQDVVNQYGEALTGIEVTVNKKTGEIITGYVLLPPELDRSDYPALSLDDVQNALDKGGLSGTSGIITITSFDIGYYVQSPYLILSDIARGTRLRPDGRTEPFTLVIPLLKASKNP